MSNIKIIFIILLNSIFIIHLVSCSSNKYTTEITSPILTSTTIDNILNLKNWQLSGRVGIKTPKESVAANFTWRQNNNNFTINFSGPLGQGATKISGSPGKVQLINSKGETYNGSSGEQLLYKLTKFKLPIAKLKYWIRGISATNQKKYRKSFTEDNWQINYLSYIKINNKLLPNKLLLNNKSLHIKIIIKNWRLT